MVYCRSSSVNWNGSKVQANSFGYNSILLYLERNEKGKGLAGKRSAEE